MKSYTVLTPDGTISESLEDKPRWVVCLVCTTGLLMLTLAAVAVGVFIGITYCYVEHKTGFADNITQKPIFQVLQIPVTNDTPDEAYKRTINGALLHVFTSKIQKILA
ncbi:unnamed protein product [Leptidea sinapis]|uniref:Uncharacterized protein n=1 Tax=Leptidea sinapis TaxID=189913 RepID=A0A5E4QJ06_9NEOP|nr:unnamed protein product [Leptidea sinapis]